MEENKLFLEACKYLGLDPEKCLPNVDNMPSQHKLATLSTVKLFIISDYINKNFNPDYTDMDQRKWQPWIKLGSSSASAFRLHSYGAWFACSCCGARLCSESLENSKKMFEEAEELYKNIFIYNRDNKSNYGVE